MARRMVVALGLSVGIVLGLMTPVAHAATDPVFASVTPSTGSYLGGETVVIQGSNLDRVTRVMFGSLTGTTRAEATIIDRPEATSQIRVVAPPSPFSDPSLGRGIQIHLYYEQGDFIYAASSPSNAYLYYGVVANVMVSSASGTLAAGAQRVFTATMRDAGDRTVLSPAGTVSFASSGDDSTLTPGQIDNVSSVNGVASATFTGARIGTARVAVSATIADITVTNTSADFIIEASTSVGVEVAADSTDLSAGDTRTVTVQVVDVAGNLITSATDSIDLQLDISSVGAVTGIGTVVANAGVASFTLTGTTAGTIDLTATAPALSSAALTPAFTVVPGPPSTGQSTVAASPSSITADGTSTSQITVVLFDDFGNPLTSSAGTVAMAATAGTLSAVSDLGTGAYRSTLTATSTPGTAIITATVNGHGLDDSTSVTFAAAPPPPPPPPPPVPPTPVVSVPGAPSMDSVHAGHERVVVTWSTPVDTGGSALTGYRVEMQTVADVEWQAVIANTDSTQTTAEVVDLTDGQAYVFRVAAYNMEGLGAYSAASDPVIPRAARPAAPTDVVGTAGAGEIAVTWLSPEDPGDDSITGFRIQYSTDAGATWQLAKRNTRSLDNVAVISKVYARYDYVFRVAAISPVGVGAFSVASAPVQPDDPVQVSILVTGERKGRRALAAGTTVGLARAWLTPYFRLPGQVGFRAGTGMRQVAANGKFTWQRRTGKKIAVRFQAVDGTRSNVVIITS